MADYHELKKEVTAAVSHIGAQVISPYNIEWLSGDQRKRIAAKNFVTDERWQFRLLAQRQILVEISYGDFLGSPVLGVSVFHRREQDKQWDHERSRAVHSAAELREYLELLNEGREAIA